MSQTKLVTIVIPFFQRERAILARALRSVLEQKDAPAIEVVIVDDASPLSADVEIMDAGLADDPRIRVVVQRNGGPGAARNTGLDHASAQTSYIAFLDSDDCWQPGHLSRAVAALEQGFDVFFANHLELGAEQDAFSSRSALGFDINAHRPLAGQSSTFLFSGDMFDQILKMNLIETSTVVYRTERLARARFRPDFRYAFEDYLFWIDLARATNRFVFSTQLSAIYGSGVNIYKSAGYGTEGAARRIAETTRFFAHVRSEFALTSAQQRQVGRVMSELRHDFASDLLHRVRHRKPLDWHWLGRQVRVDPLSALLLPANCAAIAMGPRRTDPAQSR